MHRRIDARLPELGLQALYSIGALAEFANVTRFTLRRVLQKSGVPMLKMGRAVFVPLSEIQRKIPHLWDSICAVEAGRLRASQLASRPGALPSTASRVNRR